MIFCKCYQNPLGQLLKQFSKLYQLWGPFTIIGGVVYKTFMIFKVFRVYLSEFLIFHHEIAKARQDILKNLENHGFLVYNPSNNGHVTRPQS